LIRLIFSSPEYTSLKGRLLGSTLESCAVLLAEPVRTSTGWRLLVSDIDHPIDADYANRTEVSTSLRPEYVARITRRARDAQLSVVFCHSHPFSAGQPIFSETDDDGESLLGPFMSRRVPAVPHLALVIGPDGCRARRLCDARAHVRVTEIGSDLRVRFDSQEPRFRSEPFDRQIRAFGREGQHALSTLHIGVVGTGGTGSATAQQLAHLGVKKFVLLDPDLVEIHNLNRLIGASHGDIGRPKVDVIAAALASISRDLEVDAIKGDIVDDSVARALLNLDVVFCCTDSQGSRAVMNQLAYQHLLPVIDMGVVIVSNQGRVTHIAGRVQMLAPGLACLTCRNLLDAEAVRAELLTAAQRQADPYIIGAAQPQPAVVSLNSTVASLAVTMLLGAVTRAPIHARSQIYDAVRGTVRVLEQTPVEDCIVCSAAGALRRGDQWPLPTRKAQG
jgi:molybdopterin/thiamine biosynthesis adenylyltransferase